MVRNNKVYCYKCGLRKHMIYDKVLSKKDAIKGDTRVWWCMSPKHETLIIVIREFAVSKDVSSAKNYVFRQQEPK